MKVADIRKREQLLNLYPDGVVVGFRENHNSLYQMTFFLAKRRKKTVREYIEWLGLTYVDRRLFSDDEMKDKLLSIYPNKVVSGIMNINNSVYQAVLLGAKKQNMAIKQYVEWLGFEYVDKRQKDEFQDIDRLLNETYPDKQISGFEDRSLYLKLFRLAKAEDKTTSEYLYERGFHYIASRKPLEEVIEPKMLKKLSKIYPNKIVEYLSQNNPSLYVQIKRFAYRKNMTLTEYLQSVGFEYVGGRVVVSKKIAVNN